jgi:ketosteroid isomerase-like protein
MSKRTSRITILLATCILTLACTTTGGGNAAETARFVAFLDEVDAAQLQLQNGDAAAFKSLWSRADDITLSGGFGGTVEQGWTAIGARLDWVAAQFSNGRTQRERIVTNVSGDLAYLVQLEHIQFRVPGQETDVRRDYRVTMVFRREAPGWRLVHRQADAQMQKAAPQ